MSDVFFPVGLRCGRVCLFLKSEQVIFVEEPRSAQGHEVAPLAHPSGEKTMTTLEALHGVLPGCSSWSQIPLASNGLGELVCAGGGRCVQSRCPLVSKVACQEVIRPYCLIQSNPAGLGRYILPRLRGLDNGHVRP